MMKNDNVIYYSKSTGGFYDPAFNDVPADGYEITREEHEALLDGQSLGKIIVSNSVGRPVLSDPPELSPEEISAQVTRNRSAAYQAESDPLFFKAQRGEATMEEWIAKVAEIKERFPDGVLPTV